MRILIDALQAGNRSGTGRYTTELVRHLPAAAPDLELAVLWPGQPLQDIDPRVQVVPVDITSPQQRLFRGAAALRDAVKTFAPDLIHYPANIRSWATRKPYVVTIHDVSFYRSPGWYRFSRAVYYWLTVRRSALRSKRILADSKTTADDLVELLKMPREKIDVVYLAAGSEYAPASPEELTAVLRNYNLPDRFFLYVGTIEPRKNLPNLIFAWSLIADKCPLDLVIAGRKGWKTGFTFTAAERSPFRDRIHFIDHVPEADLPALMSAADVFTWPSLCEGFGLPPLEAMACGTPVLTSNLSCMPEIVGDAAVQVDPYGPEDMAKGMLDLASNAALRDRYRQRGFERVKIYSWMQTARQTAETYKKALE